MHRIPQWLLHTPVAHRGLHDAAAGVVENSLPAFWAAARSGYPAELDVRLLADGEVVVLHDAMLDRVTAGSGPVARVTAAGLRNVPLADGTPVPLLRDVLDAIAGATPLLIEVKNEGEPGPLEEAVAALLGSYRGPFAVQSFNPGTVRYWRDHAPETPRGLLSGDFRDESIDEESRRRLRDLESLESCEPDFIGYDIRLLPREPVTRARRRGLPVIGWTARSRDAAVRALAHCDNVIFEGFDPSNLKGAS